jgi:hypothetical protein
MSDVQFKPRTYYEVGLIRFGGHPTKGVEDGHHGRDGEQEATAPAALG